MSTPYPAPPLETARRLTWPFLPPHIRAEVERRCGSEVVDAESRTSGFTPGFASVLTCADGSRHFVKAASVAAQRVFADSYREEARKLAALPAEVPAPALAWVHDDDWVVLGIVHADGAPPVRPWRPVDLDATLDALEIVADRLTPAPIDLDTFADETGGMVDGWQTIDVPQREECAALAARALEVSAGETLVHTDIRADNVLITPEGTALLVDWNWPVRGAAWIDSLMTLIGPRGDGIDVESVIAERRLLRDVPSEDIDAMLALLVGYFWPASQGPVPPTSPHLRDHQRWQGDVCWDWLCERRGWN